MAVRLYSDYPFYFCNTKIIHAHTVSTLPAREVFAVTPLLQASGTIFLNPGSIPAGSIGNLQKPEIARHAGSAGRAVPYYVLYEYIDREVILRRQRR